MQNDAMNQKNVARHADEQQGVDQQQEGEKPQEPQADPRGHKWMHQVYDQRISYRCTRYFLGRMGRMGRMGRFGRTGW